MEYVIYVYGARGYYRGNTYVHQGETFPAVTEKTEAKRYKSRKRAENAIKSLDSKCDDNFELREL